MNDIKILVSKIFSKNLNPSKSVETIYQTELKLISSQIACLDTWFQLEDDNDLVEACIYQRESLNAKYRYLIKKAKEANIILPTPIH